uniref:Uncharacterized protein n=1 Tax=Lepeophtheirus salmonis TaxID=72036 RepID=A0A0K2U1B3_LEPSM
MVPYYGRHICKSSYKTNQSNLDINYGLWRYHLVTPYNFNRMQEETVIITKILDLEGLL